MCSIKSQRHSKKGENITDVLSHKSIILYLKEVQTHVNIHGYMNPVYMHGFLADIKGKAQTSKEQSQVVSCKNVYQPAWHLN